MDFKLMAKIILVLFPLPICLTIRELDGLSKPNGFLMLKVNVLRFNQIKIFLREMKSLFHMGTNVIQEFSSIMVSLTNPMKMLTQFF